MNNTTTDSLWVVERTAPHQHGWQHIADDRFTHKEDAKLRYDFIRNRFPNYTWRLVEYKRVEP